LQESFYFIQDLQDASVFETYNTSNIPTKLCSGKGSCGRTLPTTDFYPQSNGRDGLEAICKTCWANKNATDKATRNILQRDYVAEYLRTHHCKVCGESDPAILEFDHIVPEDKEYSISNLCSQSGLHLQVLIDEIAKCWVLCANCHRKVTALERGYWILGYYPVSDTDPIRIYLNSKLTIAES